MDSYSNPLKTHLLAGGLQASGSRVRSHFLVSSFPNVSLRRRLSPVATFGMKLQAAPISLSQTADEEVCLRPDSVPVAAVAAAATWALFHPAARAPADKTRGTLLPSLPWPAQGDNS